MIIHMKTTLIIPDRIFRELKRRAGQRRTTLSEVVAETLLRGLEEAPPASTALPPLPTHDMGPPKVDIADRDALYRAMEGR
jgi:hypothetical protein